MLIGVYDFAYDALCNPLRAATCKCRQLSRSREIIHTIFIHVSDHWRNVKQSHHAISLEYRRNAATCEVQRAIALYIPLRTATYQCRQLSHARGRYSIGCLTTLTSSRHNAATCKIRTAIALRIPLRTATCPCRQLSRSSVIIHTIFIHISDH